MILSGLRGVGPVAIGKLEGLSGGDLAGVLEGRVKVAGVEGIKKKLAGWRVEVDVERELRALGEMGGRYTLRGEPGYPVGLAGLADSPAGLYNLGKGAEVWGERVIGVVGTRAASGYGREVTRGLVKGLVECGYTIVSGLAEGIDAEAHRTALREGGVTAAFLGSGFKRLYPRGHAVLMEEVAASGGVWSEYPLWRRADRQSFPQRNRLVAGAGRGVLVVESGERGGSLITARFAEELGRAVLVVPGRIDAAGSRGNHQLIRDGATLVSSVEEIMEALEGMPVGLEAVGCSQAAQRLRKAQAMEGMGVEARAVWEILKEGRALYPDQLAGQLGWSYAQVSGCLLEMELQGWVERLFDGRYEA